MNSSLSRQMSSCSILVPVRNEAGNIKCIIDTIPIFNNNTEVIFIEGHSVDQTWEIVQYECSLYDGPLNLVWVQQDGIGKWDAVQKGLNVANGDIIIIFDGDLSVDARYIYDFYQAVGDNIFINGTRMILPMEKHAMQYINFIGNKILARALSSIIKCNISDSLCGMKAFTRHNWSMMAVCISDISVIDPFGDYSLLFGAWRTKMHIKEIPVAYKSRKYGKTNISTFKDGWKLLKLIIKVI